MAWVRQEIFVSRLNEVEEGGYLNYPLSILPLYCLLDNLKNSQQIFMQLMLLGDI